MFRINPYSGFMRIGSVIFDVLVITVLFLVCCVPIVTFGAAATAMWRAMMMIHEGRDSGEIRKFFITFAQNLKLSTKVWLPLVVLGGIVAADIYICWVMDVESSAVLSAMRGLTIAATFMYLSVISYIFAGIARYEVTFRQAYTNAIILMAKNVGKSVAIVLMNALIIFSIYIGWFLAIPLVALLLYWQGVMLSRALGFEPAE